jgi:gas vesicle protein
MESHKKLIAGAALGTLLGSLAAILYPRRYEIIEQIKNHSEDMGGFTGKAREFGESLLNSGRRLSFRKVEYRDNYLKGGLIGLIVGAAAALLAAPSTGKNLRRQLSHAYNDLAERSEEVIHQFKNNSHNPFARARARAGHSGHESHAAAGVHRNGVSVKKAKATVKKTVRKK